MTELLGKTVECHNMPESSFYDAVAGTVVGVANGWATVNATRVMSKWDILWKDHPTSCTTSVPVADLELA